jgi:hypothetical protein
MLAAVLAALSLLRHADLICILPFARVGSLAPRARDGAGASGHRALAPTRASGARPACDTAAQQSFYLSVP